MSYLQHDVMLHVDTMTEHHMAGRMDSYNTMRTDLSEWVDSMVRLKDASEELLPVISNIIKTLRGEG